MFDFVINQIIAPSHLPFESLQPQFRPPSNAPNSINLVAPTFQNQLTVPQLPLPFQTPSQIANPYNLDYCGGYHTLYPNNNIYARWHPYNVNQSNHNLTYPSPTTINYNDTKTITKSEAATNYGQNTNKINNLSQIGPTDNVQIESDFMDIDGYHDDASQQSQVEEDDNDDDDDEDDQDNHDDNSCVDGYEDNATNTDYDTDEDDISGDHKESVNILLQSIHNGGNEIIDNNDNDEEEEKKDDDPLYEQRGTRGKDDILRSTKDELLFPLYCTPNKNVYKQLFCGLSYIASSKISEARHQIIRPLHGKFVKHSNETQFRQRITNLFNTV